MHVSTPAKGLSDQQADASVTSAAKRLFDMSLSLLPLDFYGRMTVIFEAGRPIRVESAQTFKPGRAAA